jgi:hypothetical protein
MTNKLSPSRQKMLRLTNGIGHGLHQYPPKLCKRNLALFTPTGNCLLAAAPHTVKRYRALYKTTTVKRKTIIWISIIFLIISACGNNLIKETSNKMDKFEAFKQKEKFIVDTTIYYPGIADSTLRPILTEKINLAADDFRKISESGSATDKKYQDIIKVGLERIKEIYVELDTEDRGRVCYYFQELMDIVGLESSNGLLNNFMYGFEPFKN